MKFKLNHLKQTEPSLIYLCKPDNKLICQLNGIEIDTVSVCKKTNNTYSLDFTVDKYITTEDGVQIESNGYEQLDVDMYLYVERVGYFRMKVPQTLNDGFYETKMVSAQSCDYELVKKSLVGFKINRGTEDSLEYLADGNVYEASPGLLLPREYISLYNRDNPQLSLLDLALEKVPNWKIGYLDPTLLVTDVPNNDGSEVQTIVKRTFEVDSNSIYSFFTQDVASAYQCIFDFDILNREINVYSVEHLGEQTGIFISFRNLAQSINITEQMEDNVYTRLNVRGEDDMNINLVNFGTSYIEDLSYYMKEQYVSASIIEKYPKWQAFVEEQRKEYVKVAKEYSQVLEKQTELMYRVPNDGCDTNWNSFSTEELNGLIETYQNMADELKELFFIDGAWTNDAAYRDYKCYTETIIPNINITLENRQGKIDDPHYKDKDLINAWESDWELYGLQELQAKADSYKENMQALVFYSRPYDELNLYEQSENYESIYSVNHERWEEYNKLLEGCNKAIEERQAEYDAVTEELNEVQSRMDAITASVDKVAYGFTEDEVKELTQLYNDGDYVNSNILTTSLDDGEDRVDRQIELLKAAWEELQNKNHPQYAFSTTIDNLYSIPEFEKWREDFDTNNFIYLSVSDNDRYFVKLRLVELTWNPCDLTSEITVGFSNMITNKSKRNDFTTLLNNAFDTAKSQIDSHVQSALNSTNITISDALINAIIKSGALSGAIQNGVYDAVEGNKGVFGELFSGVVNADQVFANSGVFKRVEAEDGMFKNVLAVEVDANLINVETLNADSAFMNYLRANLITADNAVIQELIAGIIETSALGADVGNIKNLLAGRAGVGDLQVIHLTADNVTVDEAFIKELIAARISVGDLMAGDIILSDQMRIISENNKLLMNGRLLQITGVDSNGEEYVGIQLGYDESDNPSLILKNEAGAIVLTPEGITADAIADQLINNEMLKDASIQKKKLSFPVVEGNEYGGIDISQVYDGEGGLWGVQYESFVENTEKALADVSGTIQSVDLVGEQVFIQTAKGISPESITLTAVPKNGLKIGKWYINDIENLSFVSEEGDRFTIPASYMENKRSIVVKVEGIDTTKFDVMTIYRVEDGASAYTAVISSNNGTLFKMDTELKTSTVTCNVYKGSLIVEPKSYTWYCMENDNAEYSQIGTGKTITLPLSNKILKKSLYCEVEV